MSTLVKFCIRLEIFCIPAAIIATIAVYVFHLGYWTFFGIEIGLIMEVLILASLLIVFLQDIFFKPSFTMQSGKLAKSFASRAFANAEEVSDADIIFIGEVIDALAKHERNAYRIAGIVSIAIYIALGLLVGSPIAEYITLAALFLGPVAIKAATMSPLLTMRKMDEELWDIASQTYNKIGETNLGIS